MNYDPRPGINSKLAQMEQERDAAIVRAARFEDECERLRDDLSQALRQWRMYAEETASVDLEHEDHAEAILYRQILGRINQPPRGQIAERMQSGGAGYVDQQQPRTE